LSSRDPVLKHWAIFKDIPRDSVFAGEFHEFRLTLDGVEAVAFRAVRKDA
jgi:hypothetical protein